MSGCCSTSYLVDWYRARWREEEFFKALKTRCAYEKRQIEDLHGSRTVLALIAPIACSCSCGAARPGRALEQPACAVLTSTQLDVLRVFARMPLLENATVRDAFYDQS